MNILISWSGERSKYIAKALRDWIPCVIQEADTWISTHDIERGAQWFATLTDQIRNTDLGIVCLTYENQNAPWILFESGALSRNLSDTNLCTILVDLGEKDITGPLSHFNHTQLSKSGIWELVNTINKRIIKPIPEARLQKIFDQFWPSMNPFITGFKKIKATEPTAKEDRESSGVDIDGLFKLVRSLDRRLESLDSKVKEIDPYSDLSPLLNHANAKVNLDDKSTLALNFDGYRQSELTKEALYRLQARLEAEEHLAKRRRQDMQRDKIAKLSREAQDEYEKEGGKYGINPDP